MNRNTVLAGLAGLALAGFVVAEEDVQTRFDIQVKTDDGTEPVVIAFSSDDVDFDIMDLQVGENRSFIDDQGRTVFVTKQEDGLKLEVDGSAVEIPQFAGEHGLAIAHAGQHSDIDFEVKRDVRIEMLGDGGVTILSGKEIDEVTRQSIESILQSGGHEKVNFILAGEPGQHRIHKIIRKTESL